MDSHARAKQGFAFTGRFGNEKIMEGKNMKHTKLLVVALLVALLACLVVVASADTIYWEEETSLAEAATCYREGRRVYYGYDKPASESSRAMIDTKIEFIPKTAHHWVFPATEDKAATCTARGEIYAHCDNFGCGHIDTNQVQYTPMKDHSFTDNVSAGMAATCTEPGYEPIVKCAYCGAFKDADNDGSVIPAKGHIFETAEWSVVSEATCAKEGKAARQCLRKVNGIQCTAMDYKATAKNPVHTNTSGKALKNNVTGFADNDADHWNLVEIAKPAGCTTTGCKAVYKCPTCGYKKGGESIPATGHAKDVPWAVDTEATCAHEGVAVRKCTNKDIYGNVCGYIIEKTVVPKSTTHGDVNKDLTSTKKVTSDEALTGAKSAAALGNDDVWVFITPAKDPTCTQPGCTAEYYCKICGKTVGKVASPKALGHKWQIAKDSNGVAIDGTGKYRATCINDGKIVNECVNGCGSKETIKIPAHGHYANWVPQTGSNPANGYVIWELKCTNNDCDVPNGVLTTQVVRNGEKAPSGAVTTGKVAVDSSYSNNTKGTTDVAKNGKTVTAKTSTKKSSSSKSTSTAKTTSTAAKTTTAAPATATTTKVATVAVAAALPTNAAELKADTKLYVVKNVAGEDIVLNVQVADGKITVAANLAEGESVVLYANADAIANPTAENTLVLAANEATELPAAFANAIVAVVKTDSLPAAVAAK